jgi:hypothetical protein
LGTQYKATNIFKRREFLLSWFLCVWLQKGLMIEKVCLMKHYLNFFDRNEKIGVVDGRMSTLKLIK